MTAFRGPDAGRTACRMLGARRAIALSWVLLVGGCTAVPDALNPVEWYRGAAELFESDEDRQNREAARAAEAQAPRLPGTGSAYPNLSSVPDRPAPTPAAERNRIARELAADRENARYTQPEPERRPAPFAPGAAPVAAPRLPVTPAPAVEPPPPTPPASRMDPGTDPTAPLQQVQPPRPQSAVEPPEAAVRPLPAAGPQPARTAAPSTLPAAVAEAPRPVAIAQAQPSAAAVPNSPAVAVAPPPVPPADRMATVEQVFREALAQSQPATTTRTVGPTAVDLPSSPLAAGPAPIAGALPLAPAVPATASGLRPARAGGPAATVYFPHGSAALNVDDRFALREAAALHKVHGGRVRVVGHASSRTASCDPQAREIANFRVSLRRAEAVAAELTRHGVPRERMVVSALADQGAVSCDATPEQEAESRRADVFLDY